MGRFLEAGSLTALIVGERVKIPILFVFGVSFDQKKLSVKSCIVYDRSTGSLFKFGDSVDGGKGRYYKAVRCDAGGHIIAGGERAAICSVFFNGHFIGYTFGTTDINIH